MGYGEGSIMGSHRGSASCAPGRVCGAFSLIELLTVIAIIVVLVGITVAVATGVREGGRARLTQDTLRMMDVAIDGYIRETGGPVPAIVEAPSPSGGGTAGYPLADAIDVHDGEENRVWVNSIGLFAQAASNQGLDSLLDGVPSQQITRFDGDAFLVNVTSDGVDQHQPELRTVLDAWGKPIRMVHPSFDGVITEEFKNGETRTVGDPGAPIPVSNFLQANPTKPYAVPRTQIPVQFRDASSTADAFGLLVDLARFPVLTIRRNVLSAEDRAAWSESNGPAIGDGDGGVCSGGRPYVYSAGQDGDPSTVRTDDGEREENVYSTEPKFVQGSAG